MRNYSYQGSVNRLNSKNCLHNNLVFNETNLSEFKTDNLQI